jgi:hypothetical protein
MLGRAGLALPRDAKPNRAVGLTRRALPAMIRIAILSHPDHAEPCLQRNALPGLDQH